MEPTPITLIKETCNGLPYKYFTNLKLHRDPMYSTSYLYDFKISFFDHDKMEQFLLFIRNFNITLSSTGTLETDGNIQYLCTLVHGEMLHQFDLLYVNAENT